MNEIDILLPFYEEMKAQGVNRNQIYLSIDHRMLAIYIQKHGESITMETVHKLADICIANEWLERTTIDPGYNFLSLTEAGLQILLTVLYRPRT